VRIIVAIATVGRAALTRQTTDLLADQIRPADSVLVVGASDADVAGISEARGHPEVLVARRGLCCQRNAAMEAIRKRADIVVFLDDDFVCAPDFLANIERLFEDDADLVGITGRLLADGINHGGYTIEDALRLIAARGLERDATRFPRHSLYGCNMAIRMSATEGLRFDEALPLYGWLEDVDFTYQLSGRGHMVTTELMTGVHLGVKGGRTSGKRLGYSQVANIAYLRAKGTIHPGMGERLVRQNILSNIVNTVRRHPYIDGRGRLLGNLIAFADLIRGRADPRRIERL
jgi:glycosyltransferase involved in cell wall biosynthesis